MAWKNGYIPEGDLVVFRRGRNNTDGDWYWGLTPATYARHLALVKRARDRTGRVLEPGDGWSTVRPMPAQVIARRIYGNGAAVPGTSSHGGFWEGQETLAIDYSNWLWVYNGNRNAFYEDCRAVGLSPGMIEPRRGYPDEPWHVIDLNPRSAVPAFDGVTPFIPEGADMDISELYNWRVPTPGDGVPRNVLDLVAYVAARQEQINTRQEQIVAEQKTRDGDLSSLVAGVKADINYIHTLSPYSLRAILAASGRGEVKLTDAQAAAIAGQLSATLAASLDAALKDDFAGVITAIKGQPAATVAAIKAAL